MFCKDCRWWDVEPVWRPGKHSVASPMYEARACSCPYRGMFSQHPAGPDYEGRPATLPDFGCVNFAKKESDDGQAR